MRSGVTSSPPTCLPWTAFTTALIADHRAAISKFEPVDPVTVDLLTQQAGTLELYQWFVRAHLEDKGS